MASLLPTMLIAVAAGLFAATGPAAAQPMYKITAADGTVTYTDRPPADAPRVERLGRAGTAATAAPLLPPALREPASKFPVVLYTVPDCAPCERARELLARRGVPYQERLADPQADRAAWLRAVGGFEAPALAVGAEVQRGFEAESWHVTLDLAGYPRASQLPAGFPPAPVVPLVSRAPQPAREPAAVPDTPAAAAPPAPASGIRF